jgi:hypothetical protein
LGLWAGSRGLKRKKSKRLIHLDANDFSTGRINFLAMYRKVYF